MFSSGSRAFGAEFRFVGEGRVPDSKFRLRALLIRIGFGGILQYS